MLGNPHALFNADRQDLQMFATEAWRRFHSSQPYRLRQ